MAKEEIKHILIVSHAMEIGGAERALLGLLDCFDYSKYQVDLFLFRHEGELFSYINPHVKLLPQDDGYSCLDIPLVKAIRRGQMFVAWGRILGKFLTKRFVKKNGLNANNAVAIEYSHKYTKKYLSQINPNEEYDMAISFLTPHYFIIDKVNAKKKIAWIHSDYSTMQVDKESELAMWEPYDNIVSISDDVTKAFLSLFPTLRNKIVLIENIQPEKFIYEQVEAFSVEKEMPKEEGVFRLLSVGRFCFPKNFDNIPQICKILLELGLNVKWYLIGYGMDEDLIRKEIFKYGMENNIFILGKKENPYPYIKECDLYVQPSRFEGKAVTVIEAQMLGKPVIITNYATATSQLEDGYDGIIVPMGNEGCAKGIANVLNNPVLMQILSCNCNQRDYSNIHEIEKIYQMMI